MPKTLARPASKTRRTLKPPASDTSVGLEAKSPVDERGQTVSDARRFARKATNVFLHYPTGPNVTDCILLSRRAFLAAITYRADADAMPCLLYRANRKGDFWLQIGVIGL